MGLTPLMAMVGTKNLVTASKKPISATTVGRCKVTCSPTGDIIWMQQIPFGCASSLMEQHVLQSQTAHSVLSSMFLKARWFRLHAM